MRRKKSRNKKYRNKHQIIQVMLCKKITLYYYILSIYMITSIKSKRIKKDNKLKT